MVYQLTEEEKETLEILRNDLKKLSKQLLVFLIGTVYALNKYVHYGVSSLSDFKLKNIKEKGMITILTKRAYRFFLIEEQEEGKSVSKKVKAKVKIKRLFKRTLKIVLFPIYLVFIALALLLKNKKKSKKNVINRYTP